MTRRSKDCTNVLVYSSKSTWPIIGRSVTHCPHSGDARVSLEGMNLNHRADGGSIINFSSISYMMGNAGYPSYTTANSGLTGMTRSLAREFGPDRIRVNALAPGWVLTEKQLDMWATPDALAAHLERQCLKDHLAPRDIVDTTLFLASDASRMMTGQAVVVDGGVVMTG
ncbi:enoyl-ACP reductase-like protein [Litoreibacter meonggei]|uniref:Enoyl-ACP reductase-like protein n=1 Tax=Litoreibacter meonggei TaxID=1049199 RepID=A0A497VBG2_9RHOB|nr:enoyl-ACP reductase-like protein [Litoreibacter meonggei]